MTKDLKQTEEVLPKIQRIGKEEHKRSKISKNFWILENEEPKKKEKKNK